MIRDESVRIICFFSWKRLLKKSGIVMAWPAISEYLLSLFATMSQFIYVPTASPAAVQNASASPVQYASPGSPMRSQPLISDASALKAAIQGPRDLPPR